VVFQPEPVSAPHNPISEPPAPTEPQFPLTATGFTSPPPSENPPWNGWDVLALGFVTFVTVVACVLATAYFVHLRFSPATPWIESLKRPEVIVGGQLLAYFFILILMYRIAYTGSGGKVFEAIHWNWPQNWRRYLLAGVALEVCLLPFAYLLPMPKNVPIDEFFRTARDAYILSLFGILFAPLFEELFFRGFLYPVVEVWLCQVFASRRRTRLGRNLLLMLGAWGYAVQRLPERSRLYVASALAAGTLLVGLVRMIAPELRFMDRLVLPVTCFASWSFVAYVLHGPALFKATLVPLLLACALTAILLHQPGLRGVSVLAPVGAVGITACAFAAIHASQLKYSWGPVLIIFLVGVTLTTVRALKKSVAATILMHMAYNATIFVVAYIATDAFRHMEKFNQ
jgi:membrane protease YdiL (CAAX protease family)